MEFTKLDWFIFGNLQDKGMVVVNLKCFSAASLDTFLFVSLITFN